MVIIIDDTFIDRYKFHDVDYLSSKQYQKTCTVFTIVKTLEISQILKYLPECKVFCNHKTLQLYNKDGIPLGIEDNTKYRETLLNKVSQNSVQRIEFSRGLETNYETKKIDKDLFYTNLRPFLDYYNENNIVEPKILFFGKNFLERERMTIIQKMLMQIRIRNISEFSKNPIIKEGLIILYSEPNFEIIIEEWMKTGAAKNEIIQEINNKI